MAADSEPFPPLATDRQLHSATADSGARRRRKSSILGSQLNVGDTGAPALSTSLAQLNGTPKVLPALPAARPHLSHLADTPNRTPC